MEVSTEDVEVESVVAGGAVTVAAILPSVKVMPIGPNPNEKPEPPPVDVDVGAGVEAGIEVEELPGLPPGPLPCLPVCVGASEDDVEVGLMLPLSVGVLEGPARILLKAEVTPDKIGVNGRGRIGSMPVGD